MTDNDSYEPTLDFPGDTDESSADAAPASPDVESLDHPERIGRYRIEKVLGQGGFGLVYLAYDEQLHRRVAVKVPHARLISKPEDAEAYLTEARTVANLDHPHIVPVYDVGSTDEFPCYIVSKYVEGTDLAIKLKQSRLKHTAAAELVATVAEALHYAHKQGLVHRDIKPGNILVGTDGKPYVVDFGLALREGNIGKGPKFAGTPVYMSPEQARGEGHRVDGRSDIFSLGVVFYELLVGRRPFQGDTHQKLLEQITALDARPPRQIDDSIPKELERICLKTLSKRATDRYTTAKDLADDLRHFLNSSQRSRFSSQSASTAVVARGSLSQQLGLSDQRSEVFRSTFLFVDFKGYTERVRILEETAGHRAAAEMRRSVAQYIDDTFRQLEAEITPADYELINTAGDGFFFHFRQPQDAFRFTEALNKNTAAHNLQVNDEIGEHWFSSGATTGEAAWDGGEPTGHVVNVASRLQSAATGGDLVTDKATFDALPVEMQQKFDPQQSITDKHGKSYEVYRTAFGQSLPPLPTSGLSDLSPPVFDPASSTDSSPLRIVPKGLRSFDEHDADFFLELLPGARDREGLPDSIRFWKTRIEETDPDNTFSLGLIYGPSGCGKSSLVKAGLLPRLSDDVITVAIESTPDETESRLLHGLRKRCPDLADNLSLQETLAALRRGEGVPVGKKVLIVLDQFEQWLHAQRDEEHTQLVQSLRQCDGGNVQCIVMVRDDFWMAATRFMRELEIRLLEGQNSAAVDLFPNRHAEKVLAAFGRAFSALPDDTSKTTKEQKGFLKQSVAGLAEDGKVICVRLALFAEMMKGKTWTPTTLQEVGGTAGVGVTFLEETFSVSTAPPEHRYHQKAARAVLNALLPDSGTDIKGQMKSRDELLEASGYVSRPQEFDDLIRILDSEIRLITPTDPEGIETDDDSVLQVEAGQKYYQLTHDYLVHSLRDWLTRKQKETRKGRAELRLAERSALWNAKPENRHLPSLWEWSSIRTLTSKKNWTAPQRRMMRRARGVHGVRWGSALLLTLIIGITIQQMVSAARRRNQEAIAASEAESQRKEIQTAVAAMSTAREILVPHAIKDLDDFPREMVLVELRKRFKTADDARKLPLAYALAHFDDVRVDFLVSQVGGASPDEVDNLVAALGKSETEAVVALETAARTAESEQNWRHKARLAMLALHLKSSTLAQEMCRLRPDPVQRTWFIEECSTWHGDLSKLVQLVADSDDGSLRSGVILAVGSVPVANVLAPEKQAWEPVLSNWYTTESDTLTHSAAGWALRKWEMKLPEITTSKAPADGMNWHVNNHGMTMLKIPAGSFVRKDSRGGDDALEQTVTLSRSFLLADREVTRGQFQQFMDDAECPDTEKPKDWKGAHTDSSPTEQHPVQQVNWYDAVLYCNWLSRREGLMPCYKRTGEKETIWKKEFDAWQLIPEANGYRLPTEAEWEYACRAGTVTTFSHGDDESLLDRYAVFRSNRTELPGSKLPGSKLPNGWGLFDVHGNVYEWCQDRYAGYGSEKALTDPLGPAQGERRVLRGGSFYFAQYARSANRNTYNPGLRNFDIGFRVARTYP